MTSHSNPAPARIPPRLKTRLAPCLIAVALAILSHSGAATQSAPNFIQLANSVVAVNASQCQGAEGKERHATGFIYRDHASAITALHVVRNCSALTVYYQNAGVTRSARLAKVDRGADLALLAIDDAPNVPALSLEPREPGLSDPLQVLGFSLQIPKMSSTSLHLRFGGRILKDIVPDSVARSLAQSGSPSPELTITNIEGHLVHGLSGAPIFNNSSRVVAVSDGGLDDGTVGISWGIPAAAVPHLLVSNDSAPPPSATQRNLFAAESESADLGSVTCSGTRFTKLRTVTFPQIAAFTDDMQGLGFIAGFYGIDPSPYTFDVYQDLTSGASVVLPAGVTLAPDSKGCIAHLDHGNIAMRVAVAHGSLPELHQQSLRFELDSVGGNPTNWFPDSTFTYATAHPRFDNLIVRRLAYTHASPGPAGMSQDGYVFETFAGRGDLLLATSALRTGLTPQLLQRNRACRTTPGAPGCDAVLAAYNLYVRAILAVHLTTFPIG